MNTAILTSEMEDFPSPFRLLDHLEPLPRFSDHDEDLDDIPAFRVLDLPATGVWKTSIPGEPTTLLDRDPTQIPSSSVIRRIERELRDHEYDARTVFLACRGLPRGTRRFEDAYVAARLRSFEKQRRPLGDPARVMQPVSELQHTDSLQSTLQKPSAPRLHPLAVVHLGDLMNHFGIWVIGLLAIQAWAAWRIGAFANEFLEGGRNFYFAIGFLALLTCNSCVWFRRRGNLSSAFHVPGLVLFMVASLAGFALHLRDVILTLE